ncbi:16S rRNA (guanine(966)-N(2))-methyltransferase RsmD [Rhodanobacter sp. FW510-R12]|uniref:16S rRNA (guanine(966)-N(2))-methyltransferase RsmD n=1 Tax=unclassified Rhodanobacter TaxID=2621553 RepID=UPI0007A9AB74|nr:MULTISPECIES: 16S rRNA (guanine(966)-N(2))-methyltransferase RsmD [unclassified Rhodanobacter]KZC18138.1 16S rRNA (guanine(966)-N(2))-methyltransferase RsmD [Rhodanobacter sp. FW104-R8]KZC25792.1 16S rRNA (guanine(966)-N(2))-methyltransferase RsmD [Rhodanobacter sp. FW510-T8]KZC33555.1 16S rRNA (guanine(966)-N(2))-methyltransferase RsmD [Rhodanobacter sp. FW510-R10]
MNGGRKAGPGRVRIIGGSLRNSRLEVPDLPGLRPTPERVRETLFNWLAPVLDGARCLDLCAGTGALGIEALSRGAAGVQFVERDARAAQALRANLARLKAPGGQVAELDAGLFLQGTAQPYDLAFFDPPFALDLWPALAGQLEQGGWLAAQAWIYVESPRDHVPALPPSWRLHREGHAGEVRFALYRRAFR